MKICIVLDSLIPVTKYGGTQRVVVWLARGLKHFGHEPVFIARKGSKLNFATVYPFDSKKSIDSQIPSGTDIVHLHGNMPEPVTLPFCKTIHGNSKKAAVFHPNTIFCSRKHAENHCASAYVHLGLDGSEYGQPEFDVSSNAPLVFVGKAAWSVKNLRGAINVAKIASKKIDVLGGNRINFNMGFKFYLDTHAKFYGMVGGELKNTLFKSAAGLVFPVRWHEPGATAVIESLFFGLPVFATPYGCLPELVNHDVGFLSNSSEVLGAAASRSDKYDRRLIHNYWKNNFTHLHMAKKYIQYYEKILDGENLHSSPINFPAVNLGLLPWN